MKLAHIAPTKALSNETFKSLTFHLCIASQVLKDPEYAAYYRTVPGFVMMDVPTYEDKSGVPYDFDLLSMAIDLVNPNEVILPDIWNSTPEEGIEYASNAALQLPRDTERGPLGYVAALHGASIEEYFYCAQQMSKIPGVTTLGLTETQRRVKVKRGEIIELLAKRNPDKHLHLLGLARDFADLQDRRVWRYARSMDTAKLVVYGMSCKSPVHSNFPDYPGRPEGFFEMEVSELQMSYIHKNIRYWNRLVGKEAR